MHSSNTAFSRIPSVDRVLNFKAAQQLIEVHGRDLVTEATRALLAEMRQRAA